MAKGDIRAGRAFVELFVKGAKLEQGLAAAARRIRNFGDSLNNIGQKLASFGVAAGVGIGAAVTRFASFDDQMRQVAAVSGASDQELQQLSETAMSLGKTTSFAAAEIAGLMAELGRAGFNPKQIEDATSAILDMARAAGVDATRAAEVMGAALNQFGLGADQARRVADALALTSNISATGVEDLGEALSYSGKVAADAGMSIEDTLAILASLGNVGIKGSSAGTALQRLLVITGAEATELEKIFGVAFTDAAGNVRPLVDVLAAVSDATKDMPTAERTAKMADAFGLLGITGAGAIGQAADQIRGFQEQLKAAGGSSAEAAQKMDAGIGGSFRRMRNALDAVALAIGESLAPMLSRLGAAVVSVSNTISKWVADNREVVNSIVLAIAVVGGIGAALMALSVVVTAVSFAFSGLAAVVGGVISVVTMFLNPVGLAIAGIAALAAGLAYASGIVPQLLGALTPLVGVVKSLGAALMAGDFSRAWDILATGGKYFASVLWDVFLQIPEYAGYATGRMVALFLDAFEFIGNAASTMWTELMSGNFDIGAILKKAVDAFAETQKKFGKGFEAGLGGGEAPKLNTSDRTKSLSDQLAIYDWWREQEAQNARDEADAARAASQQPGAAQAPFMEPAAAGSIGAAAAEPAVAGLKQKVDELTQSFVDGKIGYDEWQDGLENIREEVLGSLSPIEKYNKRLDELQEALNAGAINQEDHARATQQMREEVLGGLPPIEEYHARMKELRDAMAAGIISSEDYSRAAKEALPSNIKSLLDQAKTPLQKYEEQITELRDAFSEGVINQEQFSIAQEQLQKEFRSAAGNAEADRGRVTVGFSAAGLMAQGAGGGGGTKELTNRMATQIDATRDVREEVAGLRDDLARNLARFG